MTMSMRKFAAAKKGFSLISNQKLVALYSAMAECRKLAEQASRKTRRPADSILGHEAAAVGAAIDLLAHDIVAPALWPDTTLKAINPAPSLASTFPQALRHVVAGNGSRQIALFFSSSKAAAQPAWLSAVTRAAHENLPILFVFLNRPEPSVEPAIGQAALLERKGHALPVIHVDGTDVVAVYRVATEAITHARKGNGPTLIDCRLSPSTDPLLNMQNYLIGKGLHPSAF